MFVCVIVTFVATEFGMHEATRHCALCWTRDSAAAAHKQEKAAIEKLSLM
jgi:hypothetical protein